jgi:hypothetical protein
MSGQGSGAQGRRGSALTSREPGCYPKTVRDSGKVNVVGLLMLAGIVGAIYFGIMLAPAYTDNMDVSGAIASAYNQSARDDDVLRNIIQDKLRYVGEHEEDDGFGNVKIAQGLGLTDDDILIDRDTVNDTIRIEVDYTRKVELKPFKRILLLHFHPNKSGPVHAAPAR